MKIAIFHNLPPGGALRTFNEQVKYLSKNHEICLFEISDIIGNPRGILDWLEKDFKNFIFLGHIHKKVAKRIDRENFDVILVHADKYTQAPFLLKYLKTKSLYYCQEYLRLAYEKELAFCKKVSLVKFLHEQLTRFIRKTIDRQNARAADIILANSGFTKEKIAKAYGRPVWVCYPGVDAGVFRPLGFKKENQVVFVGTPAKINGFDLAKKAINLVPLSIRPKLKVISGFKLSDQQLVRVYNQSLATLCLSYNEPFGLAPIESMACQTPVIAVDQGGYKETVINCGTGFLIPRKPQILADKIVYLIEHPQAGEKMGLTGRRHVVKNFSWQTHSRKLEKYLIKLSNDL